MITRATDARFGDPLQFTFAKIAWDGHVVMVPGIGEPPPRAEAIRMLWPDDPALPADGRGVEPARRG